MIDNIPLTDPLWIEMLVDNELTVAQRQRLFAHLESTSGWKSCAMAFINEQFVVRELRSRNREPSEPQVSTEKQTATPTMTAIPSPSSSQPGKSTNWLRIALAACVLVGIGIALGRTTHPTDSRGQIVTEANADLLLTDLVDTIAQINLTEIQGVADSAKKTCLIQLVDNDYVSIFETPDKLPRLFLESLVMAGHDVEIEAQQADSIAHVHRIVIRKAPPSTTF